MQGVLGKRVSAAHPPKARDAKRFAQGHKTNVLTGARGPQVF